MTISATPSILGRTPEFDLLCLVGRPRPDYARAGTLLRIGLDWRLLSSLAATHGVRPQLVRALGELDWVGVPSEVRRSLLEFLRFHKMRSLFLAGQLIQVADRLSHASIRYATFKGPSLAAVLYGNLSLRECADIDVIVDRQQVGEAEIALGSLGYKSVDGDPAFRAAFFSYQKQFVLVRQNPSLAIDLHWDFAATNVPFPITPAEIWNNLGEVEIGGRAIPTLGRSDLALYLAGHGTKEGWRCLAWVSDFAMLIDRYPNLDWADLLDRARHKQCGRSLLLGCQLAAQLLGTRVKGDLPNLAENTVHARLAAEAIVRQLGNEFPTKSSERFLGDFELCETPMQKARVLGRLLITRTVGDYNSLPLPRPLWRLYHVTRPFRLTANAIVGLARLSLNRGREGSSSRRSWGTILKASRQADDGAP